LRRPVVVDAAALDARGLARSPSDARARGLARRSRASVRAASPSRAPRVATSRVATSRARAARRAHTPLDDATVRASATSRVSTRENKIFNI